MSARGYGMTRAQAFEQAVLALTAVITGPDLVAEVSICNATGRSMKGDTCALDMVPLPSLTHKIL
jgi:hypothetical protein